MQPFKTYYLYPANIFASREMYHITTLLGSCVAVCLYDTRQRFGGMNHFMLPLWNGKGLASPKFGNIAIRQLVQKMEFLGSDKKDLIAKVFGGAAVLDVSSELFNVGSRNADVALSELKMLNIEVVASSIKGEKARKIIFNTFTGEVRQKYIEKRGDKKS
ncbi:chemotaxis protein CheD [Candidatus Sulfidibacterium hydrothermale]|uniref:chemotaxis protein CheD n=1 Tax=Candidatus Sulfidibacterium hydrothermale TaxID=2875962 RepID=UPI001F0AFC17|nr:chemotaxis protein CheD [Candidatus Sulfidibacterium hydrothermale]UBM61869.1 chemotaxis protein CheD [Candidatus Sulfidibacterium hydrothermale]